MTATTSDWGAREAPLVFSVPVDGPGDLVVVSPDSGFVKTARAYARRLKAPLAIADKRRVDHSERAEVLDLVGDVGGLNALLADDFVIS